MNKSFKFLLSGKIYKYVIKETKIVNKRTIPSIENKFLLEKEEGKKNKYILKKEPI